MPDEITPENTFRCAVLALLFMWSSATATGADSIVGAVLARQAGVSQDITDAVFIAHYRYEEFGGDSQLAREVEHERRVFMKTFAGQHSEFLNVTVNGHPASGAERNSEMLEFRIREQAIRLMKMPLTPETRTTYRCELQGADTCAGQSAWRIGFEPAHWGLGLLRGTAWVSQADASILAIEFVPVPMPPMVSELRIRLDYADIGGNWLPSVLSMDMKVAVNLLVTRSERHITVREEYTDYSLNNGLEDEPGK